MKIAGKVAQRLEGFSFTKILTIFIDSFVEKTKSLKVGDPMDPMTDIGTVISSEQVDYSKRILDAENEGAKIITGNRRNGAQIEPTIIKDVSIDSELVKRETLDLLHQLSKLDNLDQAINYIEEDSFGLASAIVTSDERIFRKLYKKKLR